MSKDCKKHGQEVILAGLLLLPLSLSAAPAIGGRAPELELLDLAGKTVSLSQITLEDKPAILSFFGTWCDSCLKEINDFREMSRKYDAAVYLVGLDADKEKLSRFVSKHAIPFPVLWDPRAKTTGKTYDLMRGAFLVVPKTYVILPTGIIEYFAESYDDKRKAALEETLARIKNIKWNKPQEIAVYFTGSANGYIESCNCYKHPYGGFIKLDSFLKQQSGKYVSRLLLDSGDFLPYGVTGVQAGQVFRSLSILGYDAVAVGDQDLAYAGFAEKSLPKKEPFISTNLLMKEGPVGRVDKVVTFGGLKIRILSYISQEAFFLYPEQLTSKLVFKDLKEILGGGKNSDFLILLSHAGLDENRKIGSEFGQIDLIIGGHSQEVLKKSAKSGNALIVQSGGNVQNVGRVILRFDSEKKLLGHSYDIIPLTNDIPDSAIFSAIANEGKAIK